MLILSFFSAQELNWGKGMGCDFATKSCMELMDAAKEDSKTTSPFCSSLMQNAERTSCTHDLTAVGSCNLVQYSDTLPAIYQNIASVPGSSLDTADLASVGGSVTLADFCPFVQEFTWKGGEGDQQEQGGRGTRCDNVDNAPDRNNNYGLESYGGQARCFRQVSCSFCFNTLHA